jgi:hypothetical protein
MGSDYNRCLVTWFLYHCSNCFFDVQINHKCNNKTYIASNLLQKNITRIAYDEVPASSLFWGRKNLFPELQSIRVTQFGHFWDDYVFLVLIYICIQYFSFISIIISLYNTKLWRNRNIKTLPVEFCVRLLKMKNKNL